MSNCPERGTYGQSVPDVFSKPVQTQQETGAVHVYGAPVQSTFSAPVNFEVAPPASVPEPEIPPAPVVPPAPVAPPVSAEPPVPAVPSAPAAPPVPAAPSAPVVAEPVQEQGAYVPPQPAAPVAVQQQPKKSSGGSSVFASKKLLMLGGIGLAVILIVVLLISGLGGKKQDPAGEIEAAVPTAAPELEQTAPATEPTQPVVEMPEYDYSWWSGEWYGWWVLYSGDGKYEELEDQAWDVCARITVDGETGHIQLWNSNGSADALMADAEVSFGAGLTENGAFVSESGTFMDAELKHADWLVDAGVGYVKDFDHMICIDGEYIDPSDEDNSYDYYIFLRPWGMDWEDVRTADNSENLYNNMMPLLYDSWYVSLMDGAMPDSFGDTAAAGTASYEWEDFAISVVGAEQFTDSEGDEAIRIYYDFTNLSDEPESSYSLMSMLVTQDDYEQVYTFADYEDDVPEYGNDSLKIRPGVTIRCIAEYSMKPSGGPVVVKFWDYWDEEHELVVQFDPQNLPGSPGDWEIAPIVDPPWVLELPDRGSYDDYDISIDAAEIVDGYEGEVVRIYYTFTNNGDEAVNFWSTVYPVAYQDGVELNYGYAEEDVAEDENDTVDVQPGESIVVTTIYEIRSYNPVEIELEDFWTGERIGVMFYWE